MSNLDYYIVVNNDSDVGVLDLWPQQVLRRSPEGDAQYNFRLKMWEPTEFFERRWLGREDRDIREIDEQGALELIDSVCRKRNRDERDR